MVSTVVAHLNVRKATEADSFPPLFVNASPFMVRSITVLINQSTESSTVPSSVLV